MIKFAASAAIAALTFAGMAHAATITQSEIDAALALAASAPGGVTFTSTAFDPGAPAGQTVVDDFTNPVAVGYTFTGGVVQQGTTPNYAAAPAGDATNYLAVTQDTYATFSSDKNLSAFSLYIGSVDPYNYIAFADGAKLVELFSGDQLVTGANGNQSSGGMNRLFNFDFSGSGPVNTVYFGSTGYSFEFDNLAARTISAAPEPSTWALMIAGAGLIGATLRLGRRRDLAPVAA